jgi:dipeptidyl aminopeptidase/acylaminoacyl peptidase
VVSLLPWQGSYVLAILEPEGAAAAAATAGERPGRRLLFQGSGACSEGNRPFMDLFDVDTALPVSRLFECTGDKLEYPSAIVSDAGGQPITLEGLRILLTRETPTDVPQYLIMSWGAGGARSEVQISDFPHPHPQLVAPPKQLIRYSRADGVELSATLYTPPGWRAGIDPPLPCLLWAYPKEFKSKAVASQLRDSPHRFSSIAALSPLVFLARGYAVLDGPSLPIVAPENADGSDAGEPNDTYVEQLVAGAAAAVAEAVRLGAVDPARVAVGGHSYGAFMTANLLAHAPHLFAAGVARAGAYNRTLTPFGFQAEERTLWQAAETYMKMSPFMHADRIAKPLLLIHGEEDNNAGCFPLQSERFFAALKGHGAECRLVLLPHESHGYRGYESVLHVLAEMSDWLDRHTAPPADGGAAHKAAVAAFSSAQASAAAAAAAPVAAPAPVAR